MVTLIIGGSGSGKSEYAEDKVLELYHLEKEKMENGKLIYLATMQSFDEESQLKIKRHQQMRSGKGFTTKECFFDLQDITFSSQDTILLECLSNLVANEMFRESRTQASVKASILRGLEKVIDDSKHLVIVTNNIFDDGYQYDEITKEYQKLLAEINQWIAKRAQLVVEIVCGMEQVIKGKELYEKFIQ